MTTDTDTDKPAGGDITAGHQLALKGVVAAGLADGDPTAPSRIAAKVIGALVEWGYTSPRDESQPKAATTVDNVEPVAAEGSLARQFIDRQTVGNLAQLAQDAKTIAELATHIANNPQTAVSGGRTSQLAQMALQLSIAGATIAGTTAVADLIDNNK